MGKWCLQASSFNFYRIFVKLAGNQDRHKIAVEFRPDRISHFGVMCPCGRIKFSIDILWNLQVQLTFQTLEFFVTLFLVTVRPRRLKLDTHVGSGQMYHVYWNQAAAAYSSLYFFIFIAPLWKSGGYTGFALSFRHSVILSFRNLSDENFHHTFLRNCEA